MESTDSKFEVAAAQSLVSEDTCPDETSALLAAHGTPNGTVAPQSNTDNISPGHADLERSRLLSLTNETRASVYATISVLLIGVFISNTDASLVLATYGKVASEFNDLDSGSWLVSAFVLAQCVAQPLYGKLSDIYGRKVCLQAAYILFALGTAATGVGQTMGQVIAGRVVQGIGSTGMTSMVSIIITDLVPIHEVATMRSYVNVLQTTGRSSGGVIGGALTQALGWRWAFLIQIPPTILAIILVHLRLHITPKSSDTDTKWQKLRRIDFIGALGLCSTIFAACFIIDTGGQKYPWTSPVVIAMAVLLGTSFLAFIASANLVAEPIFPLRLFIKYPVWTNYTILLLQIMVQFSLMMIVPLYYQVVAKATTAEAGAYLVPAFVGNTIGGLVAGYWIRRTGWYKVPTVVGPILAMLAMVLCYVTWDGRAGAVQALAILPGGMAAGMVSSSSFVGLAAGVEEEDVAIGGSGMYLFANIGAIAGASAGAAVYQTSLRGGLELALRGVEGAEMIMQRALEDISYVQNASEKIRGLIVPAYVRSCHQVNLLEVVCAVVCVVIALFSQQKRLKR